jgi:hypothetical protein
MGEKCVNPNHVGTGRDLVLALRGQRKETPEPPRTTTGIRLTPQDRQFLKTLKIGWE